MSKAKLGDKMRGHGQNKHDFIDIFNKFKSEGHFDSVGKLLGKGSFGEVREIIFKNKTMAGKIVQQENKDEKGGEYFAHELKGRNIIKIHKIFLKEINHKNYYLIIMEKAILRDLGKLSDFYHNHNLLKLIGFPFNEKAGNNLMRFYALQIINALENLNRNHMVHFDLKPENLLISLSLIVKLSDFSLLKKVKEKESIRIPGGTSGYLTMEYFNRDAVSSENAYKQDFFSLGATLYFIKYGKLMIKYKKCEDKESYILNLLEKLQFQISKIQADEFADQDFVNLLIDLTAYKPEERPSFWQIYRNKWLHKDLKELEKTFNIFENDEEKLILELQKNDFLIEKRKQISKKPSKYKFKKIELGK